MEIEPPLLRRGRRQRKVAAAEVVAVEVAAAVAEVVAAEVVDGVAEEVVDVAEVDQERAEVAMDKLVAKISLSVNKMYFNLSSGRSSIPFTFTIQPVQWRHSATSLYMFLMRVY